MVGHGGDPEGVLKLIKADDLKKVRMETGMSQAALAKAAGVSQATIAALEAGRQAYSRHLPKIAAALRVELSTLDDDNDGTRLPNIAAEFLDIDFLEQLP